MYSTFQSFDRADWRIWFYLIAQLAGGIGLTLLLATMLWPTSRRRPRNPLLISLCFSWWISTFPCLCILYYARQVTGPPPSYHVCLASAALTMGQSILVATTAPALLFNIWLIVKTAVGAKFTNDVWTTRSTLMCLIMPYIFFVAATFISLAVGLRNPQRVHRALFYCVVDDDHLTLALGVIGTVAMIAAIVMQLWTVIILYQNRSCIRRLTNEGHISLVVRVCVFGTYVFLGLCLNVISIVDWTNPVPDLFYSTFGLAVFLVFGTQRDIWRLWVDASRSLASPVRSYSHSRCSSQSQSQPNTPRSSPLRAFGLGFHVSPRSMRGKRWPRAGAEVGPYPLSTSQQHLSLSQLNYSEGAASRSFVASPNASQTFGRMSPLAALRTSQGRQLSLSLSQFNYSRSFAQTVSYAASSPEDPVPPMPLPLTQSQTQAQTEGRESATGPNGVRISLPLPAVLSRTSKDGFDEYFTTWRDGVSLPSIVVQESTPDLAQDGEGPWGVRSPESPVTPTLLTPTSEGEVAEWAPPVPPKDVRLLKPAGLGLGMAGTSAGEERRPDSPVLGVEHSSHVSADTGVGREDDAEGGLEEGELGELRALGDDREEASTVASRYSCSTWAHSYLPQYPPSSSQDGVHGPGSKR